MSGANSAGEPLASTPQEVGDGAGELITPAEQLQSIDEDIAELTRQRELAYSELRRYRSDPQVEARRAARARYLGEAVLAVPLDAAVVRRARELAGDDAWLFEPNILAEDGVECAPEEKGGG